MRRPLLRPCTSIAVALALLAACASVAVELAAAPSSAAATASTHLVSRTDRASCTGLAPRAYWSGPSDCDVADGLTIAAGDTLIIEQGTTLTVAGPVINHGTLVARGTFQAMKAFTNHGAIEAPNRVTFGDGSRNAGTITGAGTDTGSGGLHVAERAVVVNESGGTLDVRLFNGGRFTNEGVVRLRASSETTNFGSGYHNASSGLTRIVGSYTNAPGATFTNAGVVEFTGAAFTNRAGAVAHNQPQGRFRTVTTTAEGVVPAAPTSPSGVRNDGDLQLDGPWETAGTSVNNGTICGAGVITGGSVSGAAPRSTCDPVVDPGAIPDSWQNNGTVLRTTVKDPGVRDLVSSTVHWGDGTRDSGAHSANTSGVMASDVHHVYSTPGTYEVRLEVCTAEPRCWSGTTTALVRPNSPPQPGDDTISTAEDTEVAVAISDLLANDTDVDGDSPTFNYTLDPVGGQTGVAFGRVVFRPARDFNGRGSYRYLISDGKGGAAYGHVYVDVLPVNDAPVARDDSLQAVEDSLLTIDTTAVLVNDTDVDGDALLVTAVGPAEHGRATVTDRTLTYEPPAEWSGTDVFTYTISDGTTSATARAAVHVSSVDDAPVVTGEQVATAEDSDILVDVLANDRDPEGGPLRIGGVRTSGGAASIEGDDRTIRFTPDPDSTGRFTVQYDVVDAGGTRAVGELAVDVIPVNDAPVLATPIGQRTTTGTPVRWTTAWLTTWVRDVDGDPVSVEPVSADHGSVALTADGGALEFTPDADFVGTAAVTLRFRDPHGAVAEGVVPVEVVAPGEVATVPGQVVRPHAQVRGRRVLLTWRTPHDGGSTLLRYRVRIDGRWYTTASGVPRLVVRGLAAGRHAARVAAVNSIGAGPLSSPVRFRSR